MNKPTTTQPILCCMGEKVAGCPTQFLMERAFASIDSDWRAITVEVTSDKFDAAVRGADAMSFMAIRFLDNFACVAPQQFMAPTNMNTFVGCVTSAVNQDGAWISWCHLGQAVLRISRDAEHSLRRIVWLHGDSALTRSCYAAIHDSTQRPLGVLWTAPPSTIPYLDEHRLESSQCRFLVFDQQLPTTSVTAEFTDRVTEINNLAEQIPSAIAAEQVASAIATETTQAMSSDVAAQNTLNQSDATPSSDIAAEETSDNNTGSEEPATNAAQVDRQSNEPALSPEETLLEWLRSFDGPLVVSVVGESLATLPVPTEPVHLEQALVFGEATDLNHRDFVACKQIVSISNQQLTIAAEASDFERWTGEAADIDLFIDAFDEFNDF